MLGYFELIYPKICIIIVDSPGLQITGFTYKKQVQFILYLIVLVFRRKIIESHSIVMNRKMKMQIIHYNWHKILPKIVVHSYGFLQITGKY